MLSASVSLLTIYNCTKFLWLTVSTRSGILLAAQSRTSSLGTSKISTPLILPEMAVISPQEVAIRPSVSGISLMASRNSSSASRTASPPLPSPQTVAMWLLGLLIRASVSGIPPLDTLLSVLRALMAIETVFTVLLLHQMAETLLAAVWTRLSRCGSSHPQEEWYPEQDQREESVYALSKDTRYATPGAIAILSWTCFPG